jgi:hypothetical protein
LCWQTVEQQFIPALAIASSVRGNFKKKPKMSRSIHVTYKDIKHLSKKAIDEEAKDPDSLFRQWSRKLAIKDSVPRQRKQNSKNKNIDL